MEKRLLININKQISSLTAAKALKAEDLERRLAKCRAEQESVKERIKTASEELDTESYKESVEELSKLRSLEKIYANFKTANEAKRPVTEDYSDNVITRLLQFEDDSTSEYKSAIIPSLLELKRLTDNYLAEIIRVEDTIRRWETEIHPNYHKFGESFIDPETGERSDRNGDPHPVHSVPFLGCNEALQIAKHFSQHPEILRES